MERKKKSFNTEFTEDRRRVLWLRRFVRRSWGRWWRRDLQVRAHPIEFLLTDSFDRQQIFDAMEPAALMAEIHDGLRGFGADARNFLKLFNIRDVQVQRMRRRLFLSRSHNGTENNKNRDNHGVFHGPYRASGLTSSPAVDLSPIRRGIRARLTLPISL